MAVIVTFPAGQRDRRHVKLVAGLQVVKAAGESAEPVQFFQLWDGQAVRLRHRLPLFQGIRHGPDPGEGGIPVGREPRQPGGCKLKTAPVRPVVAARPAEYVCSEDLFY
nr:hypothetical protein [Salmonella enterica]